MGVTDGADMSACQEGWVCEVAFTGCHVAPRTEW